MQEIKLLDRCKFINEVYDAVERCGVIKFYILLFSIIITSRILVIILTPQAYNFADPVIYRMTGQLASNGINPYNFHDDLIARNIIASNWISKYNYFMENGISDFNYYVSSNLPASTFLYVIMHNLSNEDPFLWRSLLILGDVLILLGFILLSFQLSISLKSFEIKMGSLMLFCLYPSLILNGTAIPEDKQFQTALLFFGLTTILMNNKSEGIKGLYVGFVLGVGVLFKFFSAFLLPIYFLALLKSGWKFRIISIFTGMFLLIVSFHVYGLEFIETMAARSVRSSVSVAQHASIWTIFQSISPVKFYYIKVIICLIIIANIMIYLFNRKIDILNATAAILVVFSSVWLIDGSMNRANISMIFAAGIFLLTDHSRGMILITINFIIHSFLIILMIIFDWELGFYESIASLSFLISYFSLLFYRPNIFMHKKLDYLLPKNL